MSPAIHHKSIFVGAELAESYAPSKTLKVIRKTMLDIPNYTDAETIIAGLL